MACKYLRGKTYWVSYYKDGTLVQHSLKTKDRATANFRKNEIENQLALGNSPFPDKKLTAEDLFDEFIESRKATAKPRTISYYTETLSPYLEFIGKKSKMSAINDKSLINYINSKNRKECTVWHIIKAVNTMMRFAVSRGYLQKNPISIQKPRIPKRTPEVWTKEETKKILESTGDPGIKNMILFNLHLGLRPAELLRIRWDDIDLKSRILTVPEAKDGEFRRIRMHPKAIEALKGMPNHTDRVFNFEEWELRKWGDKIKKAAGVTHIKRFWYSLRHTFATNFYEQTKDLKTLQEILGHSKITMTTVYVNTAGGHQEKQLKRLKYDL